MKNTTIFKIGAWAPVILGVLHLQGHIVGGEFDVKDASLVQDMQNYTLQFMGEHSVLKFYNGFSITMAFLISAFGIQCLWLAGEILQNKKAHYSSIAITAIVFILSLKYFPIFVFSTFLFTLACFVIALIKNKNNVQQATKQIELAENDA